MSLHRLLFVDLDDTLFQSRRKCPATDDLHPVAYLRDGSAHSFMSAKQRAFWQLFDGAATVIPTTARDLDSLRRVDLPFRSWSIIDYGGIILDPAGQPLEEWTERTRSGIAAPVAELDELLASAADCIARGELAAHVRMIEDFGMPLFFVAKYRDGREADLDRLQSDWVAPWVAERSERFRVHRHGNNLAVLPRSLGKEHAVRYLIDRLNREMGECVSFGIGDSVIDSAFLAECDYVMTPRGSQLFDASFAGVLT